jgi:glycosyltransferase involved in cell wall biosynthesis
METKMTDDVWVYIFTFNSEKYIGRCIDSIINQKHTLSIKVLILDDNSSDKTVALAKRLLQKSNINFRIKKNMFRYFNFFYKKHTKIYLNSFLNADCKYIAWIDGDDYFLSNNKIQKQFDFMESNPSTSISFHSYTIFDDNTSQFLHTIPMENEEVEMNNKSYVDLKEGIFAGSPTIMLRRLKPTFIPNNLHKYRGNGKFIFLWALNGKISFIPGLKSIYRIHDKNSYANLRNTKKAQISKKNKDVLSRWEIEFENGQGKTT